MNVFTEALSSNCPFEEGRNWIFPIRKWPLGDLLVEQVWESVNAENTVVSLGEILNFHDQERNFSPGSFATDLFYSAIQMSAQSHNELAFARLIDFRGGDYSARTLRNSNELLPLAFWAYRWKEVMPISWLYKIICRASTDQVDDFGNNLLHLCIIDLDVEFVRLLVEIGYDPYLMNKSNVSPLNRARCLLEKAEFDSPLNLAPTLAKIVKILNSPPV